MFKKLFLSIIIFAAGCLITSTCAAQKITYNGRLKHVTFEYYSNWKIAHNELNMEDVELPGVANTYLSVSENKRKGTMAESLEWDNDLVRGLKKIKFNGYDAYGVDNRYIIYRGDLKFIVIVSNESKDKKIAEQLKTMLASVRFK
jgi:hypothetical protein